MAVNVLFSTWMATTILYTSSMCFDAVVGWPSWMASHNAALKSPCICCKCTSAVHRTCTWWYLVSFWDRVGCKNVLHAHAKVHRKVLFAESLCCVDCLCHWWGQTFWHAYHLIISNHLDDEAFTDSTWSRQEDLVWFDWGVHFVGKYDIFAPLSMVWYYITLLAIQFPHIVVGHYNLLFLSLV